jgi:GAF domain-containing protein
MQKTEEAERLRALISMAVLDTGRERAYDDVTRMAAMVCGTPISLVSLIDSKRQWFKSRVGLNTQETPRDLAFCAHAIEHQLEVMIVHDATTDPRFSDNDLVTGDPKIRFYAGAPIVTSDHHALGTVCVIDRVPRQLARYQIDLLRHLAAEVAKLLEARPRH